MHPRTEIQQMQKIMETGKHPESTTELLTHILSELTYTPEKLGSEIGTIISYLKLFSKKSGFYPLPENL